jgi:hypothetical protein
VLYFEARKHKDLYLWLAKAPHGPSVKFHVTNGATAGSVWVCRELPAATLAAMLAGRLGDSLARLLSVLLLLLCPQYTWKLCTPLFRPDAAVHTLEELKLSGNHLKGSRPVLSFDR